VDGGGGREGGGGVSWTSDLNSDTPLSPSLPPPAQPLPHDEAEDKFKVAIDRMKMDILALGREWDEKWVASKVVDKINKWFDMTA
jgi:hypothetical protein